MIGRNWFFSLGINCCHFQEVAFYLELQHSRFFEYKQSNTGKQHRDVQNVNQFINGVPSDDPFR